MLFRSAFVVVFVIIPHASPSLCLESVLQCVAVCCSVCHHTACISLSVSRKRVAVCCSVFQCCSVLHLLQCLSSYRMYLPLCVLKACCSMLQCVSVCCSVLQCVAVCCSALHVAVFFIIKHASPSLCLSY